MSALDAIDDARTLREGIFEHSPVAVQIFSADGRSLAVNQAFRDLFEAEPPPGYNVFEDEVAAARGLPGLMRRAFAGEAIQAPRFWYDPRARPHIRPEQEPGRRVALEMTIFPLRDAARQLGHVATCFKDVTSEMEREQERDHLRALQDCSVEITTIHRADTRPSTVSPAVTRILGYTQEEFARLGRELMHPDDQARVDPGELMRNPGVPQHTEYRLRHRDGTWRWMSVTAINLLAHPTISGIVAHHHDVTELRDTAEALRRSEDQLRHSQKLDAVGRLAGGLAHDFNNLLTVILSCCDTFGQELAPGDPTREGFEEIKQAGVRAAELTQQMLAFSRRQVLELRILDPNQVVANLSKMLARVLGQGIELKLLCAPELSTVRADPGQLEQVLMNLVVNARDAMPMGGTLTLETSNVQLDAAYAREHLGTVPGPYVMIAVSDTGVGIEPAVQARIFEPFFTTKEQGKGTGLGLATVFGVVKQSGGAIWLYSEPGVGTTFKLYLPAAGSPVVASAPPQATSTDMRGTETILLVEDQEPVRRVGARILTRLGYEVLAARTPDEALALVAQHPTTIHLLLTDVVMPGMNGRELAERIAAMRPTVRMLFMSGYTENVALLAGSPGAGNAFLAKPYTPELLGRKVRQVLDAPS